MCSIIGFINHENSKEKTLKSLKKLENRGKDACGIYDGSTIEIHSSLQSFSSTTDSTKTQMCFGHGLHSIEGFQPQPIQGKGVLVFNGEIYNYKELNKQLKITTDSDTQTLLAYLDSQEKISAETLSHLSADYAFAYFRDNIITLARDPLGVKPLWYFIDENSSLEFASEKKVLNEHAKELLPTEIFHYNTQNKEVMIEERILEKPEQETQDEYHTIKDKTWELLKEAVRKRLPTNKNKKVGLLFSGGIDSTVIALILKELGCDFISYTAKIEGNNIEEAQDLIYADEISRKHFLRFHVATTHVDELEQQTIDVMNLIEDNDYIKVSVALPFYLACMRAQEDGIDVMFSGLGSEEIFAGYRRHKQAKDPNQECYEGLKIMHQRDLYRDDVITMNFTQELRVPFLDKELINYALSIPAKYKLDLEKIEEIKDEVEAKPYLNSEVRSKIVLRDATREHTKLEEKYLERQKKAAQYGSKFDKGLARLAKNAKMQKQDYLDQLWKEKIGKELPQRVKY
ncbi:MAG: asparagine synthetase B [Nanoarchaeota archaeon]|nr:asparagine synthetase B [Nanoarchaeota archaeon]